jgi:general secretion pathway protein D
VLFSGFFLAALFPAAAFADAVLTVAPSAGTVANGSSFTADVNISNVADLYDYQFDLNFNPAVLQATAVLEGSFLTSGGATFFLPGTIDDSAGTIDFNADSLLTAISGVSGSGMLLEIEFSAIAPGSSAISIPDNSDLILQDSNGALLSAAAPVGGQVQVQGDTTAGVPEPSMRWLLTAALLACCILAGNNRLRRVPVEI